jgi:hypothetical protein
MRLRPLLAALSAAALLTAAAGCGGDDKQADALSKPEYVKQANAICKAANTKVTAEAEKVFTSAAPTPAQIRSYAEKTFFPIIGQEVKDLRALPAPKGDEDTTKAIFDAVDAGLTKAKSDPALLSASDSSSPFVDANKKATAYGLTVCGAA